MEIRLTSHSEKETESFGRMLALQLRQGDVLLLRGDLGAGKTAFARGVARGFGVTGAVASPTFTLLACHEGRAPLHHFDLYRLESEHDFWDAGLEEYVGGQAVAMIEWPEKCESAMPECHLEVCLSYGARETEREIVMRAKGGFREVSL